MNFNDNQNQSKTEQIIKERLTLKAQLAMKLYKAGFDDGEVEQVLDVIQNAEDEVQVIKDSLVATNINPVGDPNQPLVDGSLKIRARYERMHKEINEMIQEIIKNRQNK